MGLYQHWTFALYYIVSEIYSSVSIGLLFWQFANDVITVDEAKRYDDASWGLHRCESMMRMIYTCTHR